MVIFRIWRISGRDACFRSALGCTARFFSALRLRLAFHKALRLWLREGRRRTAALSNQPSAFSETRTLRSRGRLRSTRRLEESPVALHDTQICACKLLIWKQLSFLFRGRKYSNVSRFWRSSLWLLALHPTKPKPGFAGAPPLAASQISPAPGRTGNGL